MRREWSAEEDRVVRESVKYFGTKQWSEVARALCESGAGTSNKTGKQVRARWVSCLDPSILAGPWTKDEQRA